MKFTEALKLLMAGKKIRRHNWFSGSYWILNHDGEIVDSTGKKLNDWSGYKDKKHKK